VKLGGPKLRLAQFNGATANKAQADRFAANTLPLIHDAQKTGASSLRAIAKILNDRGVRTARGGKWAATQVRDILHRAG
jgi:Recombinase